MWAWEDITKRAGWDKRPGIDVIWGIPVDFTGVGMMPDKPCLSYSELDPDLCYIRVTDIEVGLPLPKNWFVVI